MRIVSRAEFLTLPAGTLYHEWSSERGEAALCMKGETILSEDSADWWESHLPWLACPGDWDEVESGASVEFRPTWGREALFDDRLRYLVWDEADKARLVVLLTAADPMKSG